MPLLHITTNIGIDDIEDLSRQASKLTADILGKPESYVMVKIEDRQNLVFAGNNEPAAHLELKSLSLPESETSSMSATLCEFVERTMGVQAERVYIEFSSPARNMWGWNKSTF